MPATIRTETYDTVLTTTMRHLMEGGIHDQITRGNVVVNMLVSKGRFRSIAGGERIRVPLMYQQNSGADIYAGYGQLDTTPQDGHTSSFWPWSQMAVPITVSGLEKLQNNSREAVISLVMAKTDQSQATATELLNNCLVAGRIQSGGTGNLNAFVPRIGKLDSSANGPNPLPYLIDANPARSVSVGDINGANESWWRNNALASTAASFAAYRKEKNRMYNDCSKGVGGPPDMIISTQRVWEMYVESLTSNERYTSEQNRARQVDILGGFGMDSIMFRNAVHIWDEIVPDVGTSTANLVDNIGTHDQSGAHGTEYMMNSAAMEYIVHSNRNWIQTPFITPVNQDASVSHLLWAGQVVVNNRRKLGVIYDIDNSLVS